MVIIQTKISRESKIVSQLLHLLILVISHWVALPSQKVYRSWGGFFRPGQAQSIRSTSTLFSWLVLVFFLESLKELYLLKLSMNTAGFEPWEGFAAQNRAAFRLAVTPICEWHTHNVSETRGEALASPSYITPPPLRSPPLPPPPPPPEPRGPTR